MSDQVINDFETAAANIIRRANAAADTEPPSTPPPYHVHQCRDGVMKHSQESYEQLEPAKNGLYAKGDRFLEHRNCGTCGTTLCVEHPEFDPEKIIHQACGAPTYLCQCVEVPAPESSLTRLLTEDIKK
jgi:hypothetical protein